MMKLDKPADTASKTSFPYREKPQEYHDKFMASGSADDCSPGTEVSACLDENNEGAVGVNVRYHMHVYELIWRGREVAQIVDKWLYVFRDNALVVEVEVVTETRKSRSGVSYEITEWRGTDLEAGEKWISHGEVYLDPGPRSAPYSYVFFLSPVRLTENGIMKLTEGDNLLESGVEVTADRMGRLVAVLDPLHWAADAHRLDYLPRLKEWRAWLANHDRPAKLFIASVLQCWIDAEADSSIRSCLDQGQPESWLDDYKTDERKLRTAAEEACANLAHFVESPGYVAIETSAIETGERALAHVMQALSCITGRLVETLPGRQLVARLVDDPERLIGKYIFADQSPPNSLKFPEYRYSWLAAVTIFTDLFSAVADRFMMNKSGATDLEVFLEMIGIQAYKVRPLDRYELRKADAMLGLPTEARRIGESADKPHVDFVTTFDRLVVSLSALAELVNLGIAVDEYLKANPGDVNAKLISMVGAGADMSIVLLEVMKQLSANAPEEFLERLGGAASVVSGVCDMIGFAGKAYEDWGRHDYSSSVGNLISAAGAGVSAISGGLALLGLGGPVAIAAVGAIGAVLIMEGQFVAVLWQDTPNQVFAKHSFLGICKDGTPFHVDWGPHKLPAAGNYMQEAENLAVLLANFVIERSAPDDGDWSLIIRPGLVYPKSVFEVQFKRMYVAGVRPLEAHLKIYLEDDWIELLTREPLKKGSYVQRHEDGSVEKIRINLEAADPQRCRPTVSLVCWAKLHLDEVEGPQVPFVGGWVRTRGPFLEESAFDWMLDPEQVYSSNGTYVVPAASQ